MKQAQLGLNPKFWISGRKKKEGSYPLFPAAYCRFSVEVYRLHRTQGKDLPALPRGNAPTTLHGGPDALQTGHVEYVGILAQQHSDVGEGLLPFTVIAHRQVPPACSKFFGGPRVLPL